MNLVKEEQKPKATAYGAASLTRVLNGVDFPITKQEIINNYGEKEVNYSKSNCKKMSEIIQKTTKEIFYTMSEVVEACSRRPPRIHH